jgi:hypothetical protein
MASNKLQELGTSKWMHYCVRMVLLEVIQIIIFTFPFNMAKYVIFIICVDDFLLTCDDHEFMMFLEKSMIKSFEMSQLGATSLYIGLEFMSVQHVKLSSYKNTNE